LNLVGDSRAIERGAKYALGRRRTADVAEADEQHGDFLAGALGAPVDVGIVGGVLGGILYRWLSEEPSAQVTGGVVNPADLVRR